MRRASLSRESGDDVSHCRFLDGRDGCVDGRVEDISGYVTSVNESPKQTGKTIQTRPSQFIYNFQPNNRMFSPTQSQNGNHMTRRRTPRNESRSEALGEFSASVRESSEQKAPLKILLAFFLGVLLTFLCIRPVPVPELENNVLTNNIVEDSGVENQDVSASPERTPLSFTAYDEHGNSGYIANPSTLKEMTAAFLDEWHLFTDYFPRKDWYGHFRANLSSNFVCDLSPGQGLEDDGGYKLLTEKIRVATSVPSKKILCLMYTHEPMHSLARSAALTWGRKCDGFLAFSNMTIPELGLVELKYSGPESYNNMWQKVRAMWEYVDKFYSSQFDFFHICGDDVYLLVENLRQFVDSIEDDSQEIFAGEVVPHNRNGTYISGGAGYTLNRAALATLVRSFTTCHPKRLASYEDRLVSDCLRQSGVQFYQTRDSMGEQRYHSCSPHHLMTARASADRRANLCSRGAAYWESLAITNNNSQAGPQYGLSASAVYSVAFHDIYSPLYMVRIHSLLHGSCPPNSALGRALQSLQ